MSNYVWEIFDSLFRVVHRQGRRMEEMEARIMELERKLNAPAKGSALAPSAGLTLVTTNEPEAEIESMRKALEYIRLLCGTEKEDEFRHTLHVDIPTVIDECLKPA